MVINTAGEEIEIKRLGKANIVEQIKILSAAYKDGAEALVLECMAVDPELQYICEHKILHADIAVITNARVDHVAEMGDTTQKVCDALCNTIPEGGVVFTSDKDAFAQMQQRAAALGSQAVLADTYDFDTSLYLFPENIALALAVCEAAGVDRETALRGMGHVKPDPYEAAAFDIGCSRREGAGAGETGAGSEGAGGGITFVNGMSANDPASTAMVYERFSHLKTENGKFVIVLNTRPDRGYRTNLMIDYVMSAQPDEVWLLGSGARVAARKLSAGDAGGQKSAATATAAGKAGGQNVAPSGIPCRIYKKAAELPLHDLPCGSMIYAIGNIANEGFELMDIVQADTQIKEKEES